MCWRPSQELGPGAHISASLHGAGWGTAHGFPGARLANNDNHIGDVASHSASVVNGVLFESEDLAHFWRTLDDFEGTDSQAEVATAFLVTGGFRRCVVNTCSLSDRAAAARTVNAKSFTGVLCSPPPELTANR